MQARKDLRMLAPTSRLVLFGLILTTVLLSIVLLPRSLHATVYPPYRVDTLDCGGGRVTICPLGDRNGDGIHEIGFASYNGCLMVLDGQTGTLLDEIPKPSTDVSDDWATAYETTHNASVTGAMIDGNHVIIVGDFGAESGRGHLEIYQANYVGPGPDDYDPYTLITTVSGELPSEAGTSDTNYNVGCTVQFVDTDHDGTMDSDWDGNGEPDILVSEGLNYGYGGGLSRAVYVIDGLDVSDGSMTSFNDSRIHVFRDAHAQRYFAEASTFAYDWNGSGGIEFITGDGQNTSFYITTPKCLLFEYDGGSTADVDIIHTTPDINQAFGTTVADIGDIDGDGRDDLAIGDKWEGADSSGRVYIYVAQCVPHRSGCRSRHCPTCVLGHYPPVLFPGV